MLFRWRPCRRVCLYRAVKNPQTSTFDGLPIAERLSELKCGVAVVDVRRGQIVAMLEFQTAVEEIFDVQLLPGLRFPEVIGFQKETVDHTFVVPPQATFPSARR